MPTIVKITPHTFINDETGERINYKRLSIIGVLNGETRTLQVKLSKTELMLAELLLESTGTPDESTAINTTGDHAAAIKDFSNGFSEDAKVQPGAQPGLDI